MAINYAALQGVLNREFQEPLADAVPRANPTLNAISKKAVASDAIYLKAKLGSDHGARGIADGADVSANSAGSTRVGGSLPWVTYVADWSVNKRVIEQVSDNPGALGKILWDEISDAGKDLADKISSDIFGSAGVTPDTKLAGVQDMINTGNVYAGIDRSVGANANWRGVVVDAADGPISTLLMDKADTAFFNANYWSMRERAGMFTGVTSAAVLERYQQLFTAITLGDLSNAHFVNQMNSSGMFGDAVLGYQGVPFLRDRAVTAATGDSVTSSRLYLLNMSEIFLATLKADSADAQLHQTMGALTAEETGGIDVKIEVLPNTGEKVSGYVKAYVQLFSGNPKSAGALIKNIDIA
jgi:hypothetical protein